MSREGQVEAALIAHEPLTDYDGEIDACGCGEWYGPDTWQQHVANSADFRRILSDERAAALREAADRWQWGEWTVLTTPIKAESQPQRIIGAAQAVTDWLRARADEVTR